MAASYDHLIKVLLVGDPAVGKTSIILRFTEDAFEASTRPTICVDFKLKHLSIDGKSVKLTIWDTAGQERFRTLTASYFRGAHGIILVYDVERRETFESIQQWIEQVDAHLKGASPVLLLIGNKTDGTRAVQKTEGEHLARQNGMMFLETSAKHSIGTTAAFEEIVQKILDDPILSDLSRKTTSHKHVHLNSRADNASAQNASCCS